MKNTNIIDLLVKGGECREESFGKTKGLWQRIAAVNMLITSTSADHLPAIHRSGWNFLPRSSPANYLENVVYMVESVTKQFYTLLHSSTADLYM